MIFSPKFQNLVEAVVYIAVYAKPYAVRGTEICKAQNMPERYLENELQNLVHSGILKSVRGPKGGYILAKERRNISLADIYLASKGLEEKPNQKSKFAKLVLAPVLKSLEEETLETLREITIDELVAFSAASGIYNVEDANANAEFTI